MGARLISRRNPKDAQKRETRTVAFVFLAILGPLLLMYALIASDMRSDLSGLRTRPADSPGHATLVGWHDIGASPGPSRMLGYMMDGAQPVPDGTEIADFILMPEAGQIGHPAHRIPNEMVDVQIGGGQVIPYADRSLVWVTGDLTAVRQTPGKNLPAWTLRNARVEPAAQADVTRWSAAR